MARRASGGSAAKRSIARAMASGDGVLVYTDGVIEARDPAGGLFGEQRLSDTLAARVFELELEAYPAALKQLLEGG